MFFIFSGKMTRRWNWRKKWDKSGCAWLTWRGRWQSKQWGRPSTAPWPDSQKMSKVKEILVSTIWRILQNCKLASQLFGLILKHVFPSENAMSLFQTRSSPWSGRLIQSYPLSTKFWTTPLWWEWRATLPSRRPLTPNILTPSTNWIETTHRL